MEKAMKTCQVQAKAVIPEYTLKDQHQRTSYDQ
jgi:hypothetical protein